MILLNSLKEIQARRAAGPPPPVPLDLVEARMREVIAAFAEAGEPQWTGEEYGGFVLVEAGDDVHDLRSAGLCPDSGGLLGATWEAATWHPIERAWEVLVLYGGDVGCTFYVPDAPWLDAELRAKLDAEAESPPEPSGNPGAVPF